jgi:cytoskeletal protein RodZ
VKKIQTLSFLATLAIALGMISWGSALHAQDTTPSTTPNSQAQQPSSTPDTTPTPPPDSTDRTPSSSQSPSSQSPDATTPPPSQSAPSASQSGSSAADQSAASAGGTQTFSGTVTKQGDKYVLKDDSGKTYDIDHQDEVKKFDGKRVRVQGTLDPATNKIMVK